MNKEKTKYQEEEEENSGHKLIFDEIPGLQKTVLLS